MYVQTAPLLTVFRDPLSPLLGNPGTRAMAEEVPLWALMGGQDGPGQAMNAVLFRSSPEYMIKKNTYPT